MEQKKQDIENALNDVLSECKNQEKEIAKRTTSLNQCEREIEDCALDVIRKTTECHKLVKQAQEDIFKEQISALNQWKENELEKVQKEKSRLEHLDNNQRDIADSSSSLLKHTKSPDFISQSNTLLTNNRLANLPPASMTSLDRVHYQQPSHRCLQDSQHFRNYMQEHILGCFARDGPTTEVSEPPLSGPSFHTGSIQSEFSVADVSHITDVSKRPELYSTENFPRIKAELVNSAHIGIFEGSQLKIVYSAFFSGNSMWICGSRNNSGLLSKFKKENVFLNVKMPGLSVLTKKKKEDKAEEQTIMFPFGDYILYAKKKGSEVFSFHTQSHTFLRKHNSVALSIAAMCGSDHHVFILNEKDLKYITVLDSNLKHEGKIATYLIETEVKGSSFDICPIKSKLSDLQDKGTIYHTIVISSSSPYGLVIAVNQTQGKLWQFDCTSNPELGMTFNPCSVSSDDDGNIFIADQARDTVGLFHRVFQIL